MKRYYYLANHGEKRFWIERRLGFECHDTTFYTAGLPRERISGRLRPAARGYFAIGPMLKFMLDHC